MVDSDHSTRESDGAATKGDARAAVPAYSGLLGEVFDVVCEHLISTGDLDPDGSATGRGWRVRTLHRVFQHAVSELRLVARCMHGEREDAPTLTLLLDAARLELYGAELLIDAAGIGVA